MTGHPASAGASTAGTDSSPGRTMAAYRFAAWQQPARMMQVPIPDPGPGQVLLRVTAAGICHSDLHVLGAAPGVMAFEPPFTLGHEIAGTVVRVGAGVQWWQSGDAVAVHGVWACGQCPRCLAGHENYCVRPRPAVGPGLGADGGLAEFLLVPEQRHLVRADGLAPEVVAPLADAGLTSLHAVSRSADRLGTDSIAVVIGVGGLGHLAIQLLKVLTPASVLAVDTRPEALELALRCGADAACPPDAAPVELQRLGDIVGTARGADLVLDFVGAPPTVALASSSVAADGDLTIIGGSGGEIVVGKHVGLPAGIRLSMPFWGTRAELDQVLQLARRRLLRPEVEVFDFADVETAYQRLRSASVTGRAVVRMAIAPPLDFGPEQN